MDWLENLLFNSDSIAHIVLLYSIVISLGVLLGRINLTKEKEAMSQEEAANQPGKPHRMYVEVITAQVLILVFG